ncbi:FAD-binding oxidoreductase [Patescibacteria group bacterium]|nr:FAD-binding oxidoreductase [Patescibacteria group bacterium]MBU1501040.1 FAD-binding oxidoreductase [Patescibacteria group bacterium]MBU2080670.1 FAD-binding oxidoreductase [Patescibacteria group bacterium]MBU2124255.1 FAD-binding oxidoreductase [Patescibacteria group bacterium]MBU2194381.1 FAD-binding oxidoreductase [Patescibacteria group bacterium]
MADERLRERIAASVKGDVSNDAAVRKLFSRDTSVFEKTPELVVYPKDASDVSALVRTINGARKDGISASITARSAGTDMSGGPLTDSVVAVFTKYMNRIIEVGDGYAVAEPGAYYRDFEKATLAHGRQLMPSYPASKDIAAIGGIVNNDSGGERTLEYGKTRDYVEEIDVVLSDGTLMTCKQQSKEEVDRLASFDTLEGRIYRDLRTLITENKERIDKARPHVSKNSAGYALWEVMDEDGGMNLAKLVCGAQGTLALMTRTKLRLVKEQPYRSMLVVFLNDIEILPEIVRRVLPFNPESFESYDDHTFGLAIKFLPQMLQQMGLVEATRLGISFLPEVGMVLRGGVPKLVLMAEFSEDTHQEALFKTGQARAALKDLNVSMRIARNEQAAAKYWKVRRESFALLRKNAHGLYAAPFIDDFVVPPDSYPEFLPKLNSLLAEYDLLYTIAGHIGNGNFHIIPLMNLQDKKVRDIILELAPRVYKLVLEYGGTTTGEHNDGIIRTPYLTQQFGKEMVHLFEETKRIFDPLTIFNPGKKVGGTFADIERDMLRSI